MDEEKSTTEIQEIGSEKSESGIKGDLERLNTALNFTRNSLEEVKVQLEKEREMRKRYEGNIVQLKGDISYLKNKREALSESLKNSEDQIERAHAKRRMAVEQSDKLKTEMQTLRRSKGELERRLSALEGGSDENGAEAKRSQEIN